MAKEIQTMHFCASKKQLTLDLHTGVYRLGGWGETVSF